MDGRRPRAAESRRVHHPRIGETDDMTPEQVIMFLVATHGVETLENYGYSAVAGKSPA